MGTKCISDFDENGWLNGEIGSTVSSLIARIVWVGKRIDLEKELVVRRFKN